nr:hypothetical protein BaRGS_016046 [Batillaria attramentaria]
MRRAGAEKPPDAELSVAYISGAASIDTARQNETASSKRISEHEYTYIDGTIKHDDVTDRKPPTAPALDDNYSLPHVPATEPSQPAAAQAASVYSLAHNPYSKASNTPKYFILEEAGKVSSASGDDPGKGGQYFILEEGAADDEPDDKKMLTSQGAVTMHGATEYSSLDQAGRSDNRDDQGAEYTPLSKTLKDKQAAHSVQGQKKDGQYFILEEDAAEDDEDQGKGGQYFILEEDAATEAGERDKGGQYFILEEDAAKHDGHPTKDGQYFILEEDAANENEDQQQGGQYFILEEGAAAMDDDKEDPDKEYSRLNPADRGDNSSDIDREYISLKLTPKETSREQNSHK